MDRKSLKCSIYNSLTSGQTQSAEEYLVIWAKPPEQLLGLSLWWGFVVWFLTCDQAVSL